MCFLPLQQDFYSKCPPCVPQNSSQIYAFAEKYLKLRVGNRELCGNVDVGDTVVTKGDELSLQYYRAMGKAVPLPSLPISLPLPFSPVCSPFAFLSSSLSSLCPLPVCCDYGSGSRAGVRLIRGVRPNRAADFKGPPILTSWGAYSDLKSPDPP